MSLQVAPMGATGSPHGGYLFLNLTSKDGGYLLSYSFPPNFKDGGYLLSHSFIQWFNDGGYLWHNWGLPDNLLISVRFQVWGLPTDLLISARFQIWGLPEKFAYYGQISNVGATFDRPGGYLVIYFSRPDFHITVWHTWGLCYLVLPDFKDVGYLWCAWGLPLTNLGATY